jgi:bifunctional non-homologous end joining protein LigD
MPDRMRVHVEGRELEVSNLDKVLYPRTGFTKGEVIDYYVRVAPVLLPYLRGRPLTRIRHPNGVDEQGFFEKNAPAGTPDWVRTVTLPVPGSTRARETIDYVVVDDLPTLVWLANLAAIELHTPQWRVTKGGDPRPPDFLVTDLDPGPGVGLAECGLVAVAARERFALDGLAAAPKTSGKKGMQLICPLPGRWSSEQTSEYAKGVAEDLERALPELVVSRMAKNLRPGKVFFDWSQNNAAKTTVAPYSLRAGDVPIVSAPLSWAEVESGRIAPLGPADVLARVAADGDLLGT